MAENLMTKVWALDFLAHRWTVPVEGGGEEERAFTSPNVKYVTLAVARHSLHSGSCFASQKTLSSDTGVSKQTVARVIAELESAGWVRRIVRSREDGGKSTDRLWLTLPEVVLAAEVVPPRPQRFFPGAVSESDHDVDPPTTVVGHPAPPRGGAPLTESGQEGEVEGEGKKASSPGEAGPAPAVDFKAAVDLIWQRASKMGRQRSSKADIEKALRAAVGRGNAIDRVLKGLGAYFASADATKDDGAFQRGAHVVLTNDRWASFLDDEQARADAGETVTPAAAAVQADLGTTDAPSPKRQRLWMELWKQGMPWDPERGPQPGRLGCRVADDLQREFGAEPYKAGDDDDDAAFA